MNPSRLARLVWQSVNRNRRDFIFSSIGIVIGISTLLFFTALGEGIRKTVLEEVFVIRQIEIEPKSYDIGMFRTSGLFGGKKLTDETVATFQALPGVKSVFPKMKFTFPSGLIGGKQLIGNDIRAELIADGIPIDLIDPKEVKNELAFKDWDAVACTQDTDCVAGFSCQDAVCTGKPCTRANADTVCAGPAYCDRYQGDICQMPIPVVANPAMIEIYNGSVHTALGGAQGALSKLPKLTPGALVGIEGEAVLGRSFFLGKAAAGRSVRKRLKLVGFSPKAINLGATIPIGYVKRLNKEFNPEGDHEAYHSIVVETKSNEAIAEVARVATEDMGFALSDKYENAERAGLLILLVTLVFNLISLIILAVAAVNIMHTFLMIILERRKELGLMRAVGATAGQIRLMILSEATVLGLFGGTLGAGLGYLATLGVDAVFARQIQDFPFKPDSLFLFEPWMFGLAVAAALLFCWFGALLPAIRASQIDPAAALTGR